MYAQILLDYLSGLLSVLLFVCLSPSVHLSVCLSILVIASLESTPVQRTKKSEKSKNAANSSNEKNNSNLKGISSQSSIQEFPLPCYVLPWLLSILVNGWERDLFEPFVLWPLAKDHTSRPFKQFVDLPILGPFRRLSYNDQFVIINVFFFTFTFFFNFTSRLQEQQKTRQSDNNKNKNKVVIKTTHIVTLGVFYSTRDICDNIGVVESKL